jgi:hypothetical protein
MLFLNRTLRVKNFYQCNITLIVPIRRGGKASKVSQKIAPKNLFANRQHSKERRYEEPRNADYNSSDGNEYGNVENFLNDAQYSWEVLEKYSIVTSITGLSIVSIFDKIKRDREKSELAKKDEIIGNKDKALVEKDQIIDNKDKTIAEKDKIILKQQEFIAKILTGEKIGVKDKVSDIDIWQLFFPITALSKKKNQGIIDNAYKKHQDFEKTTVIEAKENHRVVQKKLDPISEDHT